MVLPEAAFQPQKGIASPAVVHTVRRIESARPYFPPYPPSARLETRSMAQYQVSYADDYHFQSRPVPPPHQPNLLSWLRSVLQLHSHAVMVRPSSVDQLA
jgi:hypothetical protein